MRERPPKTPTEIVTAQDQIRAMCDACHTEQRFAFDTEFVMEDCYQSELCLLQVATHDRIWLIDPFLDIDLDPVWQLVCDPDIRTIVHAGQEDLAIAVNRTGKPPRRVSDLQVVAGLIGYDYPISLQRLIQSTRHIRLHKAKTLTDWRKRPLSESQLHYAAEDVQFLLPACDLLYEKLKKLERLDWAEEESVRLEDISFYQRAVEDKLFKIKGAGSLSGRQLAVASALMNWRDEVARRYNRPARIVLKDHLLLEVARHEMQSFSEVRDLRGINLKDADVRALCVAVQAGLDTPKDEYPEPKPRDIETPEESVLMPFLTSIVRGYCVDHSIAYALAATQRTIRRLIRDDRARRNGSESGNVELLCGWRGRTVGKLLADVLAGRFVAQVVTRNGALAVDVRPA